MARGDPLRAKEIFDTVDAEWFERAMIWRAETRKAKVPDLVVGMYQKD